MTAEKPINKAGGGFKDIPAGTKFGRLTVIERAPNKPGVTCAQWRCVCECGKEKITQGIYLRKNLVRSCGCLYDETRLTAGQKNRRHGESNGKTPEHRCWSGMNSRCNNPNHPDYANYGGRGIKVCERWRVYENFRDDMGRKPDPTWSLDRIDVNGNYCPENCRWASATEQIRNRTNTAFVEFEGQRMSLPECAEKNGVEYSTLRRRVRGYGIDIHRAVKMKNRPKAKCPRRFEDLGFEWVY